jgi:AraC-like DNA-binding protein
VRLETSLPRAAQRLIMPPPNGQVICDRPGHVWYWSKEAMRHPLPLSDRLLHRMYVDDCQHKLKAASADAPLGIRVREAMVTYDGEVNLDEVSAKLGLTPRTLQRRLKEEGTSFRDAIADFKIERACTLLTSTRLSIAEIGSRVGYGDAAAFSNAFRHRLGFGPRDFRKLRQAPSVT